ncbi:hypothetical protein [Novosphingobium acidiphilum]|uniref:hypothetical protein n=1 Tax=Novosphingobium acidiphilum TaxID=505248 RepID=UPI00040020EA|nr:hypothetical protein [Novosphingobium acidiphilum]
MLIPGPRLNTLFRSRWNALLWAAGMLLTAYCSVPSLEETNAEDKPAATGGNTKPSISPWAREPAAAQSAK